MIDGVKKVIKRANATYPKPGHQAPLGAHHLRAQQPRSHCKGPHDQKQQRYKPQYVIAKVHGCQQGTQGQHDTDFQKALKLAVELQHGRQHLGWCFGARRLAQGLLIAQGLLVWPSVDWLTRILVTGISWAPAADALQSQSCGKNS